MNLDFADRLDIDTFKAKCRDQREIARRWPAYDPRMVGVEEFGWRLGPWSLRFALEIWGEPRWHGSAAVLEEIGSETLDIGNGAKVDVPQDALLAVSSWSPEHFEQARFILAETFGPILRPHDKFQPALETMGLWCMHWQIPYEGARFWKKQQN